MKKIFLILALFITTIVLASDKVQPIIKIVPATGSSAVISYDSVMFDKYSIEGFFTFIGIPVCWGEDDSSSGDGMTTDCVRVDVAPLYYNEFNVSLPRLSGSTGNTFKRTWIADTTTWTTLVASNSLGSRVNIPAVTITPKTCQGLLLKATITNSAAGDSMKFIEIVQVH